MVLSMTGYGKAERKNKDHIFSVEIKSLNGRYFDVISRIDEKLYDFEQSIIDILKKKCVRGKIYLTINISKNASSKSSLVLNEAKLKKYVKLSKDIKNKLKLSDTLSLGHLMKVSNLFDNSIIHNDDNKNRKTLMLTVNGAIEDFIRYRKKEGANLKSDIIEKNTLIRKNMDKIKKFSKFNISTEHSKYGKRIKRFMLDFKLPLDKDRLYQEIAIFLDKKDINEEIIRMYSHIKLCNTYLKSKNHSGKKINFLIQEMNREINTIGSKTDNIKISYLVVEVKNDLEKIKEQVQNIL